MPLPVSLTTNNPSRPIQQRKPQQTSAGVLNLFSVTGEGFPPQKLQLRRLPMHPGSKERRRSTARRERPNPRRQRSRGAIGKEGQEHPASPPRGEPPAGQPRERLRGRGEQSWLRVPQPRATPLTPAGLAGISPSLA